jgi:hypothetical protein
MIRGCIESVTPRQVRGWIHAEGRSLRDMPLLAFSGRECIGAGQVAIFRQDLADAGLGDGYLGFDILISGERAEDLASVVVRLDQSDALLLQSEARVVGSAQAMGRMSAEEIRAEIAGYRWMLAQGWIDQADYDLLKGLTARGMYELALPRMQRSENERQQAFVDIARRAFGLLMRREVSLKIRPVSELAEITAMALAPDAGHERPVVALYGEGFGLRMIEGGHAQGVVDSAGVMDVDFAVEPYQMLLVDARCPMQALHFKSGDQLTMICVEPSAAGR